MITRSGAQDGHTGAYDSEQHQERTDHGRDAALEAARGADSEDRPHHQPEIEAAGMNQQPLEDVPAPAQMRAAHAAGVVEMCERAFDVLPASTHQATPTGAANPPTIAIHRRLRFRLLRPVASTPGGLRDVGPEDRKSTRLNSS